MEQELTNLLASVAPRLYWSRAPQKVTERPYVVLSRISGIRDYHTQGPSGHVESRVQVDIYGDSYAAVNAMSHSIVTTLSGHRGGPIQGIFVDSERDLTGLESSDPNELFRTSIDVIVHHSE